MQRISPMLWFDNQAEEAAKFYCSVFKNSKMGTVSHYGDNMPMPKGNALVAEFFIDGQRFTALNGGPMFKFNESVSFVVSVETQQELDYYWEKLTSAGGSPSQCGWLKDKFGLSWQVVPMQLGKWMTGPNGGKVGQAIMKMKKLDMGELERASSG